MSVSCIDEISDPSAYIQELTFSASCQSETKTALKDGNEVYWLPGDQIALSGATEPFTTDIDEPSDFTRFTGSAAQASEYYAVYPYSSLKFWNGSIVTVEIPQIQTAVKGTFADDLNISVASTSADDMLLRFHNILGYVKFTISEESGSIKFVTVRTIDGESLAGDVQIDCSSDSPSASAAESSISSVTLSSETLLEPGNYYIALLPGTYASGLEFTFTNEEGLIATKQIACELNLSVGQIRNIGEIKDLEFGENIEAQLAKEREALIAIYDALNGDNWTNNTNWCSDKPVSEWYGIAIDDNGCVRGINLFQNNVVGSISDRLNELTSLEYLKVDYNSIPEIPEFIVSLPRLHTLSMRGCGITDFPKEMKIFRNLSHLYLNQNEFNCELPESIGELKELVELQLQGAGLYGSIPETIGNLTNLRRLNLDWNEFTGEIPESLGRLSKLEHIVINANYLSGRVPESVMKLDCWPNSWLWIIDQIGEGISREGLVIPAPKFSTTTVEGDIISNDIYSENEYTVLYGYYDWCPYSDQFTPKLIELYEGYKEKGLGVMSFNDEGTVDTHKAYLDKFNITWPDVLLSYQLSAFTFGSYSGSSPNVNLVDKDGFVVFNCYYDDYNDLESFLMERLGPPEDTEHPDHYVSIDYSSDGSVVTLQTASIGNGIDIVVMGDGYSDRQIADGTYRTDMEYLYNNFFTEEPYKSYKDMFNVHYVNVVSATEGYAYNDTALDGYFGEGTLVGGDDNACFEYALNAISENDMDEALVVVVMNQNYYAGTCYMYYPESVTGTYGSGPAVAYFAKGGDGTTMETFAQLLHHEANGHGFAKLADEYAYEDMGTVPSDYVSQIRTQHNEWGWWKNVDFTSDPTAVRWSHFINDTRYANEGLGAYEGGLTYWSGVWRPTENSIMRYNTGGFNAPSREAIWYRIHKLAYGDSWEYDYEDFVEYDAVNRTTSTSVQKSRKNYVEKPFEPTSPPVVVGKSWRDALN